MQTPSNARPRLHLFFPSVRKIIASAPALPQTRANRSAPRRCPARIVAYPQIRVSAGRSRLSFLLTFPPLLVYTKGNGETAAFIVSPFCYLLIVRCFRAISFLLSFQFPQEALQVRFDWSRSARPQSARLWSVPANPRIRAQTRAIPRNPAQSRAENRTRRSQKGTARFSRSGFASAGAGLPCLTRADRRRVRPCRRAGFISPRRRRKLRKESGPMGLPPPRPALPESGLHFAAAPPKAPQGKRAYGSAAMSGPRQSAVFKSQPM